MRATEAGHAWARANVKPGMTELDVYAGVFTACYAAAGQPVVVYGDFAVSPGVGEAGRRRRPAHVLPPGDTLILDFSVVIHGYRSDFTNTLVVGGRADGRPAEAVRPVRGRDGGRREAAAGRGRRARRCTTPCAAVFAAAGLADSFPHHAGHGLGLAHPEAPFFVRDATETLVAGDVVTLEPGLYVDGVGGVRIEHNYLVTESGFERLSNHAIALEVTAGATRRPTAHINSAARPVIRGSRSRCRPGSGLYPGWSGRCC